MTAKLAKLFSDRLGDEGPTWANVVALTPRGNATERHVAYAALLRLREIAAKQRKSLRRNHRDRFVGLAPPSADDDATLQIFLRAKLLKAGAPCYVPENADAFVSVADLRRIFLAFGAIPTYPVLGNPVLAGEQNIESLLDGLEGVGFYAVEVIPHRNTRERLREIVFAARARWWPVFNGTEHNTPETRPLLDPFALDPEFEPWFHQSMALLLGHQRWWRRVNEGLWTEKARPPSPIPRTALSTSARPGSKASVQRAATVAAQAC